MRSRSADVVSIGAPGNGKTHLATAVDIQSIEHGRRKSGPFHGRAGHPLKQEKIANRAGQLAKQFLHRDGVMLDDFDNLPVTSRGAVLFDLLRKLFERTSEGHRQPDLSQRALPLKGPT